jgi:very-short-patch-repair endonuclease
MGGRLSGSVDRAIVRLAAAQSRVVKWQQLRDAGLAPNSIAYRAAVGWLYRVHPGIYLLEPPATASKTTLFAAAVYACGDGALLSHLSAAELWGLLAAQTGDIHVTAIGRNPGERRQGVRVHRAVRLDTRDVRTRHRIRLTSPARTALDVATLLDGDELELLLATARVERLASDRELRAVLRRYPSHPGAARLKTVMRRDGGPAFTRSKAEQLMLRLCRQAQLPTPKTNTRLNGYEVDFYWPDAKLVVEVDGYEFHKDRKAFERDRERDATLTAAGYRVIRITWRALTERPFVVIARIAQALGNA